MRESGVGCPTSGRRLTEKTSDQPISTEIHSFSSCDTDMKRSWGVCDRKGINALLGSQRLTIWPSR